MSELDGGGSQLGHPWTSSRGEKCLGTLDGAVPHFILTSSSVPMNCTAVEGVMAALHDCCWTTQPWEKVPDRWSRLTSSRRWFSDTQPPSSQLQRRYFSAGRAELTRRPDAWLGQLRSVRPAWAASVLCWTACGTPRCTTLLLLVSVRRKDGLDAQTTCSLSDRWRRPGKLYQELSRAHFYFFLTDKVKKCFTSIHIPSDLAWRLGGGPKPLPLI